MCGASKEALSQLPPSFIFHRMCGVYRQKSRFRIIYKCPYRSTIAFQLIILLTQCKVDPSIHEVYSIGCLMILFADAYYRYPKENIYTVICNRISFLTSDSFSLRTIYIASRNDHSQGGPILFGSTDMI